MKKQNCYINHVQKDNQYLIYLELVKEGMHEIYNSENAEVARAKFEEMGEWIKQAKVFYQLEKWWKISMLDGIHSRIISSID
jgi:hypothetical protein